MNPATELTLFSLLIFLLASSLSIVLWPICSVTLRVLVDFLLWTTQRWKNDSWHYHSESERLRRLNRELMQLPKREVPK